MKTSRYEYQYPSNEEELINLLGSKDFPEIAPAWYGEKYKDCPDLWVDLVTCHELVYKNAAKNAVK